jgi:hypothetical protein
MINVVQLINRLKLEPAEFPAAPDGHTGRDMEQRAKTESHDCACCHQLAGAALVAQTPIGPRWVDVCPDCYCHLLRLAPFEGIEP